jgi:predicted PurR-regulated permease PerM
MSLPSPAPAAPPPRPDRVAAFLSERTVKQLTALAAFAALLVVFRQLLPLLVFFVAFERALGAASLFVSRKTGMARRASVGVLSLAILAAVGVLASLGVGRAARSIGHMRDTFPDKIAAVREHPLYQRLHEQLGDTDKVVEGAKHYGTDALHYASAIGHILVYATIGLILAIVYLLEEEELVALHKSLDPRSLVGTLARWVGHVCDAVLVTVQLQLIVAACNTALTLPILLWLRIPHIPSLMVLIFVSGLVPVIGNLVSGAVLSLLAYQSKGWFGVGLFVALTAVLHKLESYYLNPRLTARHVHLPGFVLILSLLAWEHLLGFVGLFVSFPFLFVAGRIRRELRDEPPA